MKKNLALGKSLRKRTDYVMTFPVVSTDCLTEEDLAMLAEVANADMRGELTPDAPLVAQYPEGFFVWVTLDDYDTVEDAIADLKMSDTAKQTFRYMYAGLAKTRDLVLSIRFDGCGLPYEELKARCKETA